MLTAWEIEIEGVAVRWRQWDCLNAKTGTIGYKMEDGDFDQYGGEWKIISDGAHGSLLSLKSDIDWGIPRLEPYLLKPLQKKTTLLFKGFLKSIQQVSDDGQ